MLQEASGQRAELGVHTREQIFFFPLGPVTS